MSNKLQEWQGSMWTDGKAVYTMSDNQNKPFERSLDEFFRMRDRIVSNMKRGTQAYSKNFVEAVYRTAAILDGDYYV